MTAAGYDDADGTTLRLWPVEATGEEFAALVARLEAEVARATREPVVEEVPEALQAMRGKTRRSVEGVK